MKLCNTSQNTTCNITEINREEHNKRKITRVGCKTMSFDIISLLSVIIHSIWPKRAFWGKESLSCSILRGSLLTVWFYLPIHHFVIKKKNLYCFFPIWTTNSIKIYLSRIKHLICIYNKIHESKNQLLRFLLVTKFVL